MTETREWKLLSMEQLMILAAGMGIRQFYGMEAKNLPEMTEEAYMQQIFSMTRDGLLETEGNHVAVSGEYRKLFRQVRDASRVLVCYPGDESRPQCCCYCGDAVTVMESSAVDENRMRVCSMSYQELGDYISGEIYFPESLPEVPEGFLEGERKQTFDGRFLPVEELIRHRDTYLIIDSLNPSDGAVKERIRVTEDPFGYGLIYQGEEELRRFYQREWMIRYLSRMTGGRMDDQG